MSSTGVVFRFGSFEVRTGSCELYKYGTRLKLRGQPYRILEVLLERAGQVVTRDEIQERLWASDTFVDFEHGLNTSIKKLRKVLSDSVAEPRYIETLPTVGYRFIAPVEKADPQTESPLAAEDREESETLEVAGDALSPVAGARPQFGHGGVSPRRSTIWIRSLAIAAVGVFIVSVSLISSKGTQLLPRTLRNMLAPAPKTYKTLAVLPLQSLSSDPSHDYFADGITDELIENFAQFGNFRVISRSSAMHFKGTNKTAPQIGKELGADALVEGSVEREGNRVRVRVELIDAAGDRHLWAKSYDREVSDVLMLESSVAHDIAEEVQGHIGYQEPQMSSSSSRAVNPEAYEAYLKARYFWSKRSSEGLTKSIDFFQQAIALDPSLAVAYAGLADAYSILGSDVLPVEIARAKAREAARKAIELDPALAEGHAAMALVEFYYDWNWKDAEREFQLAVRLNPNCASAHQWYSYYLRAMSRFPEAVQEAKRAQELDPLSLSANTTLAGQYISASQYDQAIAIDQKTLEMDSGFVPAHLSLGLVYEEKQMWPQAIDELKKAVDLSQNSATPLAALACAFGLSGKRMEARRIVESLEELSAQKYVSSFEVAKAFVAIDDHDNALRCLEKAYREHESQLPFLKVTKALVPLYADPRFQNLQRRMHFPQ